MAQDVYERAQRASYFPPGGLDAGLAAVTSGGDSVVRVAAPGSQQNRHDLFALAVDKPPGDRNDIVSGAEGTTYLPAADHPLGYPSDFVGPPHCPPTQTSVDYLSGNCPLSAGGTVQVKVCSDITTTWYKAMWVPNEFGEMHWQCAPSSSVTETQCGECGAWV